MQVDAIISTIGFPLVGGPAGTMEGGRQADIAKEILSSKNVPYFVAAPLLIQDLRSWVQSGVAGLQSVVRRCSIPNIVRKRVCHRVFVGWLACLSL
jgi:magnesium chelatase subunit H